MIHQKEVVFGAGVFTNTVERSGVVDFSIPFMDSSYAILTSIPKTQANIFQFIKPFSGTVWGLILVFLITTSIGLISAIWLTEYKPKTDAERFSPHDIVFNVIAAFFEQGVPCYPSCISGRCLLGFWLVFSLVIVAIYTANLAAVLTVSAPVKPINSLEDLSERTDLDVILRNGTTLWTLFKFSKEPVYQKIFKRVVQPAAIEDTVQKVLNGKACYISDLQHLQYIMASTCGQVRIAEEKFQHQLFSFPIQKNSVFKKQIDNSLQLLMETGVIDKIKNKWLNRKTNCIRPQSEESTIYKLNMDRLMGVFLVFVSFVSLAVVSYAVEIILWRY